MALADNSTGNRKPFALLISGCISVYVYDITIRIFNKISAEDFRNTDFANIEYYYL